MKISVIINNHNYARFLPDAVLNAFSQTQSPFEVIIVDDGSSDESLSVAQQLKAQYPTLIIISQSNGGQLSAFRAGIKVATGDWCAFLDSDDYWKREHLALAASAIKHHPNLGVYYSNHQESYGPPLFHSKWPNGIMGPSSALVIQTGCRIGTITSTLIVQTSLAKRLSDILADLESSWRIRADDCLVYGAAILGEKFYYDPTPTVVYRIHGSNHFATSFISDDNVFLTKLQKLRERVASYVGINERNLKYNLLSEAFLIDNFVHRKIRRRYLRAIRKRKDISYFGKVLVSFQFMVRSK